LPKSTGTVDIQPLFFKLTLDATTALLFGKSIYSLMEGTEVVWPKVSGLLHGTSFTILANSVRLAQRVINSWKHISKIAKGEEKY